MKSVPFARRAAAAVLASAVLASAALTAFASDASPLPEHAASSSQGAPDAGGTPDASQGAAPSAEENAAPALEIGRASCRKECRSRWSPYH